MFRGFEGILRGRDPLDAQQITQRICGVCPISHGLTSVQCLEDAFGIQPCDNGRIEQNLILLANYIQSHIIHFYHLAALDFVDITAILSYSGKDSVMQQLKSWVSTCLARKDLFPAAPFLPRFEGDYIADKDVNCHLIHSYVKAFEARGIAHEMGAVFGAKLPHSTSIVPGGCTQEVTMERILAYTTRLNKLKAFCEDVYLPDVIAAAGIMPEHWGTGKGYDNFLSFGVFRTNAEGDKYIPPGVVINGKWEAFDPKYITEQVGFSRFSSQSDLHPFDGETSPAPHKENAYSWLKAPRYKGHPMEVGPLSRVMVNVLSPEDNWIKKAATKVLNAHSLKAQQLNSVLGRHLVRALEAIWLIPYAYESLDQLAIGKKTALPLSIPDKAQGAGFCEAPRGALGHWINIEKKKIANYQCIVPTTWNCSPKDDAGVIGPIEKSLIGTPIPDPKQPLNSGRVVRAFDPCLACAVH
ncbi:MAG: nickel-dependent hydrogenase large subunit [Planctomycetes bacterium]|nr:nickel-dependent hydrogenase large subunit [Planctomycetota bacterium]